MPDLKDLIVEVHRRSLWQVLGIYAVGAWFAYEVILSLTEGGILPGWFPGVTVGLFIIGLPIVLATAFVQEGLPSRARGRDGGSDDGGAVGPGAGAEDTAAAAAGPRAGAGSGDRSGTFGRRSSRDRLFTWRNAIFGGVFAFAGAGVVGGTMMFLAPGDRPGAAGEPIGERSVAVLPFENMSADAENQYFSDGLTEELLNALAQVPELQVAARTSSFALRDEGLDIREAGSRLGVEYVVEGSVRKAGDQVRITAQLIRADNGFHLWSETYDRGLSDIFGVQDEIARAITQTLRIRLVGDGELVERETTSPRAHDFYLLGLSEWNRRTIESVHRAAAHFEQAVAEDPEYARAHAGLALTRILIPQYDPGASAQESMEGARTAARRALRLDPGSAQALTALADIAWRFEYDPDAAEEWFRRALSENPNYATAHQWYGELLMTAGRDEEALEALQRAETLDPLSLIIRTIHAMALLRARGPEAAFEQLGHAAEIDPRFSTVHYYSFLAHLEAGDREAAARSWGRYATFEGTELVDHREDVLRIERAIAAGESGPEGRAILRSWYTELGLLPSDLAVVYAAVGDTEGALDLLEISVEERHANLGNTLGYPIFDPIRDDPRFRAVVERMGFRP